MIERLLETWLSKANERSFQIPFCHALAAEGYAVVHMSRHCAMEMGKDIIAIAPDGVPCAYQLKGADGGRITLAKWRQDLSQQIHPLVHRKIVHPSVPPHAIHRSYVVLNGDLDEEVQHDIDAFNRANADSGQPERSVQTIVKGQLFRMFRDLQSDFWATNLNDLKTYLELVTADGRGPLPKDKLCTLFEASLPFNSESGKDPSHDACVRAVSGCAILCASAVAPFTNAENHATEFEAWTLFWGYTLGLVERWGIPPVKLRFATELAEEAMYTALGRLCDELEARDHFVEGDISLDVHVYRIRMTQVLGLMGVYGLWRRERIKAGWEAADDKRSQFLYDLVHGRDGLLLLWGEYAVPQILAYTFYRRTIGGDPADVRMYLALIQGITTRNGPESKGGLHNPYYDAEAVLAHSLGLDNPPIEDSFAGSSYMLEGVLHLLVRTMWKQSLVSIFPAITHVGFRSFVPDEPWQFYRYRNRETGIEHQRFLRPPHRWPELQAAAAESEGKEVPEMLRQYPIQYLCFIITLPHRANSSGVRWVSSRLEEF